MKILKILSMLVFVLAVIIVGGLAFLVYAFDANKYKEQIVTVVKKQTGRDLVIDGDLKLSVFPDLAIELDHTSLSNATGFSGKHFADIGSGAISVKLLPLLKKEVKLDEIRLKDLKLNLHRKADGSTNWDDLAAKGEKKPEKKDKKPNEIVQEMLDNLSIAGVSLENANIHWRDDQGGQDITLAPVNLKTGAFRPGKPLPIDLALTMKLKEPSMTVMAEGNTTVTLGKDNQSFTLAGLNLDTQVTGSVVPKGTFHAKLNGDIKGSTSLITIPNLKLQTQVTGDLIPKGKATTNITGAINFNIDTQQVDISGLQMTSDVDGELVGGGQLHALTTSSSAHFDMKSQKLALKGLDVKADVKGGYLKNGDASAHITSQVQFDLASQLLNLANLNIDVTSKGELLQGATAHAVIAGGSTQVNLANTEVKIPTFTLNTTVNGGPVPGGKLTQQAQGSVDLNWGKKTGGVSLPSLTVNVADLQLKGSNIQAQPLVDKPAVTGQFQTNTFNLKQVLKTLGIEPPVTANPQALSQVQASFSLDADTQHATLNNLQAKLDSSTLSGKAAINDFTKQAIFANLKIDSINADHYLPPTSEGGQTASTNKPAGNAPEAELLPMETLKALNLDTTLDIGKLVINKLKLSNIHTKVKAANGIVKLDPANASLYKGNYAGNITIDASQKTPSMSMHHELTGLRSEGLLFDLFADKYVSGNTKIVTNFTSKGNTISALLQNLNGDTSMSFKDGTIRDSKLAEKVSLAVKAFEKKTVDGDKSVVTFTGLSGDWKTKNGVFNTQNLLLSSPYFNISGAGMADIANQKLDMNIRIGKVGSEKIFAPLRVYGTFSDPKFSLDLKALAKALAQEDLDKLKKDAKEKLALAEKEAREKLDREKARAKAQLEEKKHELQARFQQEKEAKEKQLRAQLDKKKEEAANKLRDKIGNKATEEIEKQLGDNAGDVEDKVKDKIKQGLRGLF